MDFKKILFVLLILFFNCNLISANGLQVLNSTIININKTNNINQDFNIQINNQESFSFYNISIGDNIIIQKKIIPQINSGEIINVTLVAIADINWVGDIPIIGYYTSQIGASNQSYNVNVDFADGLDKCDFSIIKGDKVTWNSNVIDEIKLKNEDTGEDVTTMSSISNYTMNFESSSSFKYSFFRRGYRFTDICIITALNDNGLVNNPEYNTKINLNIVNNYEQTILEVNLIENNHIMNFSSAQEGVLTIKNIGSKIAKNIVLSGEWMSFNKNNFDLDINEQKAIIYNINPIIFSSNDTNKQYNKTLYVNGNFPLINKSIDIFINYASIITTDNTPTNLTSWIELFCTQNPSACDLTPQIVYKYIGNTSDNSFNVSFEQQQVRDLFAFMFQQADTNQVTLNYYKSSINELNQNLSIMKDEVALTRQELSLEKQMREKAESNSSFGVILFLLIFLLGVMIALVWLGILYRRKRKLEI